MTNPKYCFWSVCDGAYGALMENCVRTARRAGVFKEFHVLSDRPLAGCESYDAYKFEKAGGWFKLDYLKVGMSRLNFDYFVWLDADTVFTRNPIDLLGPLGKSPMHIPLETNLSTLNEDANFNGLSLHRLRDFTRQQGVANQIYWCRSAFWMVHHDAIDTVCALAIEFLSNAKTTGLALDVSATLGYAMQILCADPEAHLLTNHPRLWASDDEGLFRDTLPDGKPWVWREPFSASETEVQPAIIHLPNSRGLLRLRTVEE